MRRAAVSLAALVLCLTGCQQLSSWFPKQDKVAEAQKNAPAHEAMSSTVTPEQKLDIEMAVARSLENEGQTDDAVRLYLEVVKKDGRRVDAYHRLALLYSAKGEWGSSKKYYELALKKSPKNADLYCDLGYSGYLQNRLGDAESNLRQAIALQPHHTRAHNNLGLVLARTGREAGALEEFGKAGCGEADSHANLGLAYTLESRWAEAKVQYRLALAADPNLPAARNGLAALQSMDSKVATAAPSALDRSNGALANRGENLMR
jgi:Tfp pilus assembly protein PilF